MIGSTARSIRKSSRRVRFARAVVALVVGALTLAACGGGEDAASTSESDGGLQEVTFLNILPIESLSFAPELVASTCGQFEEEGLDVTFEATQGSAPAIQTIIAGSALLTRVGDIETILAAGDKQAPIVNIGTVTKQGPIRMVSSSDDPIETAEDFRGKMVGTPSEGGTSSTTLDLVASSAGIDPSEVDRQVVGLAPGVFDLVTSGRIDAYIVSLDTSILLEKQQEKAVVYDPSDDIKSGAQLYMTSTEQAEDPEKQDQIRRYLAAVESAINFMIEDEANGFAETLKCISSEYEVPAMADPEVAKETLSGYVKSWTAAGEGTIAHTDTQQWEDTYREMVDAGLIEDGLDPNDWVNNDFAPGKS